MYKFTITGTVQGVGFRPYIYSACAERGLHGSVQNTGLGVVVEVDDRDAFIEILEHVPENARIDSYTVEEISGDHSTFTIKESMGEGYAPIPPDFFLCDACLAELKDKDNRRYHYFFTTCTNCGPRFSITKKTPYDRATTSMTTFAMCEACTHEYNDPLDRRYHAQTIACPSCGPRLALYEAGTVRSKDDEDALIQTINILHRGEVVAIKGIGGFHLACRITPQGVETLKKIRERADKPFAIMCKDIDMVQTIGNPNEAQQNALFAPERAIVLIPKKKSLDSVSELDTVGVMLPYSALHHLLFEYLDEPLIMTSSNLRDAPMSTTRESQVVPYVLDHTREIVHAVDDSVVKLIAGHTFFIRRSRGYVPQSLRISPSEQTVLALGAEMNNTFCVAKPDGTVTLSPHMGNTAHLDTFEHWKTQVDMFLRFTDTEPDCIAVDLHPHYNTSCHGALLSEELSIPLIRVQHHRAHAHSVALEHGLTDFVGIVCDGLGYGDDGALWGGEIFDNDTRVGHLEQHLQVGGDSATQHPSKMLFSILRNFLSVSETARFMRDAFTHAELTLLDTQRREKFNAPITSGCGRILDAASYLLGFCDTRTYEGRPAMLLEARSFGPLALPPVIKDNILLTTPLFEFLIANFEKDHARLGATVQRYLAEGLHQIASQYKKPIVWSGGCAYNTIMSGYLIDQGVLVNKNIPAGDGGVCVGQVGRALSHLSSL